MSGRSPVSDDVHLQLCRAPLVHNQQGNGHEQRGTANSTTGKRSEETGRLDEISAGSMSLPELLQEPLILPPRSDLRTFLARSCFSSKSTKRARSGGREPGMLRSSLNFLPNTLGVAAWSSICPPTFDQPTRSALARFLTKRGVFTSGGPPRKGAH